MNNFNKADKFTTYALIYSANLLGYGSLAVFAGFLFFGSFGIVKMSLSDFGLLLFDAGLSLLFFAQHSIMVRKSFRGLTGDFIPTEHYRVLYAITSGFFLFAIVFLWQKTDCSILVINGPMRIGCRLVFLLSITGFYWGTLSLKHFDSLGTRSALNRLKGKSPRKTPFAVKGAYRWVRHPFYFFSLLMIWSFPDLTADRLLFNLLWTGWIVAGAFFEERDLVDEFGDLYRKYQKEVPMLIPVRFPVDAKESRD
jgi:protein-S-isoprenylcysteine O-methyltransferase Ste14